MEICLMEKWPNIIAKKDMISALFVYLCVYYH